ncbi:hypothetical protein J2S43_004562 [Catenuloplanes nepalensis]|uniref:Orc1-like AAA ATPase domain-containing protein n=1 Tax=Catenuloplanes nepalensis TaxID=587533 RepID=A0ABT9MXE7_9ACTN|nr:AAA family ATPase [Catenuloplanes nepalensis]MDP9796050.1 hypothetical protein [Catenuloplanes nepalensis]
MIGRDRELAAVRRLLDRAAAGTGGHLVVTGPAGAGRTALADAAASEARARGLTITRIDGGQPDWDAVPDPGGRPGLLVLDDLDRAGPSAVANLHHHAPRLPSGATAILATVTTTHLAPSQPASPGLASSGLASSGRASSGRASPGRASPGLASAGLASIRLAPLGEADLSRLVPDLPPDAVHALWLASAGWPGVALDLAAGLDPAGHALVELALGTASRADFLAQDAALIRLLETAAARDPAPEPAASIRDPAGAVAAPWDSAGASVPVRDSVGVSVPVRDSAGPVVPVRDPAGPVVSGQGRVGPAVSGGRPAPESVAAARDPGPAVVRARVLARLARELLGDPSAASRRRALIDEATALARVAGDPAATAEVLDCRLHALWDPAAAGERLAAGAEIVGLARAAGHGELERRGLFWRFTALAELGDLDAAEAALAGYARAGELDGDPAATVVVRARQALLAIVRGRFVPAEMLILEVAALGHRAGLADTDRLTASLRGRLALLRGTPDGHAESLLELARRLPGQFFEATAARVLAESGRDDEALLELDRLLPAVLSGTGPRWLGAVADLAFVASRGGPLPAAAALYDALTPYTGRLVVWGGANMITGPVDEYLGRLATRLGRPAEANLYLDRAIALAERLGALPWLASALTARARPGDALRAHEINHRLGLRGTDRTASAEVGGSGPVDAREGDRGLGPRGSHRIASAGAGGDTPGGDRDTGPSGVEWRLVRDGGDWWLAAGAETARVRDSLGMRHLRALLAAPGREIAALDLAAGGAGLRPPAAEPVLDDEGRATFRRRLTAIDDELAAADRTGDVDAATRLTAERAALLVQLRRAAGLGGRPRRQSPEAERARVGVTRALRTAIARIETVAPLAGAHLRASVRTGAYPRYQPVAGGPARWRV